MKYYRDKAINEDSIMKKKIETDIQSLATDLLNVKNSRSTQEWKEITMQLYEKLCVLEYLEKQLGVSEETPKSWPLETTKHSIHKKDNEEESTISFEEKSQSIKSEEAKPEPIVETMQQDATEHFDEKPEEEIASSPTDNEQPDAIRFEENIEAVDSEEMEIGTDTNPITEVEKVTTEIKHTTVEVTSEKTTAQQPIKREADELERFASTYKKTPTFDRKQPSSDTNSNANTAQASKKPKSLNESLNRGLHIGLNDRIAFINHLFSGSTQDFNRVLSQINTMNDFDSVQDFLENQIKPDYRNWEGKEEYSERFTTIIEKKFS